MREIIEAGAGCGKTYGLVTRYLAALGVARDDAPKRYAQTSPGKILTLTFTNDAAEEMRSRISAALLEAGRTDLAKAVEETGRISTFHSFCYKVLKPHLPGLGYPDSEVLSVIESQAHKMNHVLKTLATSPLSERVQKLMDLKRLYTFCAANWRRPRREIEAEIEATYAEVRRHTDLWMASALAEFRAAMDQRAEMFEDAEMWPHETFEALTDRAWESLKKINFGKKGYKAWWKQEFPHLHLRAGLARDFAQKELYRYLDPALYRAEAQAFAVIFDFLDEVQATAPKLLDFDALEIETQKFLGAHPAQAPRYDLIIVDEFQDTNRRQVEILELLTHPQTEVYYVGDPKQAIYSFRGGDVRVFEAQKLKLQVSSLDTNRRSLPHVLSFMNELTRATFTEADDPAPQMLRPSDQKIHFAQSLESKIVITEGPRRGEDFWDTLAADLKNAGEDSTRAVLCQQWSRAFEAHEALRRRGVPVALGNDLDLGKHHLSALWIAYLKAQGDRDAEATHHWNFLAGEWNLHPLPTELVESENAGPQDPRAWLRLFVNAVAPHRWPEGTLWLATLESWIQNHSAQLRWIPTAPELASSFQKSMNLRLTLESPASILSGPAHASRVVITTIHKAKGLQYQNVFLFDLFEGARRGSHQSVTDADDEESLESLPIRTEDGRLVRALYFKYKKALADQKVLAEKKRLFYVAYTRAEENLYFYTDARATTSKTSTSLESEWWRWPAAGGLAWSDALYSARDRSQGHLPIEHRTLHDENAGDVEGDPLVSPPADEQWTVPGPRKGASAPAPFLRAGARTYIDEVLFPEDQRRAADLVAKDVPRERVANPTGSLELGSALHKILETWDGRADRAEILLARYPEVQRPALRTALANLAEFADLKDLWSDAQHHPERVQREMGLFIHGDNYRLSGFADLVWFRDAATAVVLDWKSSSTEWAAFTPLKVQKTEAQVSLYAASLRAHVPRVEIWALAVIFEPTIQLRWLFRKSLI